VIPKIQALEVNLGLPDGLKDSDLLTA